MEMSEHGMGDTTCPNCGKPTNKFIGDCEHCGYNRWKKND